MVDLARGDQVLEPIRAVVTEILTLSPDIDAHRIMVVGAACRDVLHRAMGHDDELRATRDVDIALALSEWTGYHALIARLRPLDGAGNGIRYRVASLAVDLLPFGLVEDPVGIVKPRPRDEAMSVWAFHEVFATSQALPLGNNLEVRLPTIPGYAALKLCAWLDRAAYHQYKDAADLAATLLWYAQSDEVGDRLYDTDHGTDILLMSGMDAEAAAAHVLGEDVAAVLGDERRQELVARWPGGHRAALLREMNLPSRTGWSSDPRRRDQVLAALERGLGVR